MNKDTKTSFFNIYTQKNFLSGNPNIDRNQLKNVFNKAIRGLLPVHKSYESHWVCEH